MTLQELQATQKPAGPHVGDVALPSLSGARVSVDLLKQIWEGQGLDKNLLPETPTPEQALKIATRDAQTGKENLRFEVSRKTSEEINVVLMRSRYNHVGDNDPTQEGKITLFRNTGKIHIDVPNLPIMQEVQAGFDVLVGTHTEDAIRRMLVRTMEGPLQGFLLKRGVYFIPAPYASEIRSVAKAVSQIGQSTVGLLSLYRNAETMVTLASEAKGCLESEVKAIKEELVQFAAEVQAGDGPRTATLEARITKFQEIRSKANLYHDVLALSVEDLEEGIKKMEVLVNTMIEASAE